MTKNEARDVMINRLNDLIYLQRRQNAPAEKIARFEAERDAIIAKIDAAADDAFDSVEWVQNNPAKMAADVGAIIGAP